VVSRQRWYYLQSEAPFGIVSASPKTASEAKTVLENVWQNNKMEVKPVEAMFCGSIPLVEAEMSFMDRFTPEAGQENPFGTSSLEALREAVQRGPNDHNQSSLDQ